MAIIRTDRPDSFTLINNIPINDQSLDWKDLGLLVYLLSKPDGWQVNAEHLANVRKTGVKGIYSGLQAISSAGYATKKPNPQKGGWDWLIFDTPQQQCGTPEIGTPKTGKPHSAPNAYKRNAENRQTANNDGCSIDNSCKPHSAPNAYKRNAENGRQVNTEYLVNTDTKRTITTTREGSILNETQREIFVWASTHDYWHKVTFSEEEFLKVLCSPKGGMRRQFENRYKEQTGGNHATRQQPARPAKVSAAERVEQAITERYGNAAENVIELDQQHYRTA